MPEAWDKLSEIYGSPDATQTPAQMAQPGARFQEPGPSVSDIYAKATSREPGWTYGEVLPIARGPEGQMAPAVPGFIYDAFSGMNRALKGELPTYEPDPQTGEPRLSQDLLRSGAAAANLAATGSLGAPAAPAGSLRAMHGIYSRLADNRKLTLAESLESRGASAEEIHAATGWFKGLDGKWRFEVPDTGSRWLENAPTEYSQILKKEVMDFPIFGRASPNLSEVFEGPLLHGYPDIGQIPVEAPFMSMGALGSYHRPPNEFIQIGRLSPEEALPILLHEAGGHAIAQRESFAPGASVSQFLPADHKTRKAQAEAIFEPIAQYIRDRGANPAMIRYMIEDQLAGRAPRPYQTQEWAKTPLSGQQVRDIVQYLRQTAELKAERKKAEQQYFNDPGEREARNIERRFKTDDYSSFPLSTMDPLK